MDSVIVAALVLTRRYFHQLSPNSIAALNIHCFNCRLLTIISHISSQFRLLFAFDPLKRKLSCLFTIGLNRQTIMWFCLIVFVAWTKEPFGMLSDSVCTHACQTEEKNNNRNFWNISGEWEWKTTEIWTKTNSGYALNGERLFANSALHWAFVEVFFRICYCLCRRFSIKEIHHCRVSNFNCILQYVRTKK